MARAHHYRLRHKEPPELDMTTFMNLMVVLVPGQALRDALLARGYQVEFTQLPGIDHMAMGGARPQTVLAILELARGG